MNNRSNRVEETYPYNLLDEIFQDQIVWVDDDDHRAGLDRALHSLSERECEVLLYRFKDKMKLDDIGKVYGVMRERIRQIEAKAIRKLRHPSRQAMIVHGAEGASIYYGLKDYEAQLNSREKELKDREERLLSILERFKAMYDEIHPEEKDCSDKAENSQEDSIMNKDIGDVELDFTVRSLNCLRRSGIHTVSELCKYVENGNLAHTRNLGRKSMDEILRKLQAIGKDYSSIY